MSKKPLTVTSFGNILKKNEEKASSEKDSDLIRTSANVPLEVDIRVQYIVKKYNSTFKRVYMSLTEYGYYRRMEETDNLDSIYDLKDELNKSRNRLIRHALNRGKAPVDNLEDPESNTIYVSQDIYSNIKRISKAINAQTISQVRICWYTALKALEDLDHLEGFEKGKFDDNIAISKNYISDLLSNMQEFEKLEKMQKDVIEGEEK